MKSFTPGFIILSLLSAGFLSAGFLFPHCGAFALVGFVPLLWMDRIATQRGYRHFWRWHYLTFVLWNAATTFWVCNATVGGGIAAVLINALEMSVIWALFRLFKRRFTGSLPYIFLVCIWIAWERAYYSAEVSWPWLTLGNAFASTTSVVQWYDLTGTIGGSLWVWLCNLSVFGLVTALARGSWSGLNRKARIAAVTACTAIFTIPPVVSVTKYCGFEEKTSDGSLSACALQPNLDPYLKFEKYTQDEQDAILCSLMTDAKEAARGENDSIALFVTPETVTGDVTVGNVAASRTLGHLVAAAGGSEVLFGASSYEFILSPKAPSYTARPAGKGRWYENHNSAILASSGTEPQIYHKSRLVVGTEKMPWPRLMRRVDKALGGGVIARCTGQEKISLLRLNKVADVLGRPVDVGCAVCYESVYPEYFASYVAAGASAMAVITNDAWWGDTPGYRQHCNYSRLRAIETRRDIVRSANTGISCFINQRGDLVSTLGWDRQGSLCGRINLNGDLTPFVRYGDITGRTCTFLFWILAAALVVRLVLSPRKKRTAKK